MHKKKDDTLSNYLEHYIQANIALENYEKHRKAKELPVGGAVTFDDIESAHEDASKFLEATSCNNYLEYRKRNLSKKIKAFLAGLRIDDAVFKQGKQYVMTEPMVYLVDYILEDRKGAADRVIHQELHRVSKRECLYIDSLVEAAIRLGPASPETKEQVMKTFSDFLLDSVGDLGDFPERYQNKVVEKILRYVRDVEPVKSVDELDWEIVVETVYERLFKTEALVAEEEKTTYMQGSSLTEH